MGRIHHVQQHAHFRPPSSHSPFSLCFCTKRNYRNSYRYPYPPPSVLFTLEFREFHSCEKQSRNLRIEFHSFHTNSHYSRDRNSSSLSPPPFFFYSHVPGWVNVQLVDFRGKFKSGVCFMKLWLNTKANPIGTCSENYAHDAPTIGYEKRRGKRSEEGGKKEKDFCLWCCLLVFCVTCNNSLHLFNVVLSSAISHPSPNQ